MDIIERFGARETERGRRYAGDDPSYFNVIARVFQLAAHLDRVATAAFAPFGLSRAEADTLGSLFRAGTSVAPTALSEMSLCSTGAMTNRLDNLEAHGLVRRVPDADDRRSLRVELTEKGAETITAAIDARIAVHDELLPGLTREQREQLADLLRTTLIATEATR